MHKLKYLVIAPMLFAMSGFNSAKAITADELLVLVQNWSQQVADTFGQVSDILVSHEQRLNRLEGQSPNFGGYGLPFSTDGELKNVIVASLETEFGETLYYIRSRYATSTEEISIDGVLTQRPFIANYGFVNTDDQGNIQFVSNYIEAPDTEDYINFNIESSTYDPVTLQKNVDPDGDTLRESWPCSGREVLICLITQTENATGQITDNYTWSYARAVGTGPLTVNDMTFPDIRVEVRFENPAQRVRARGIGEVLRMTQNGDRKAIYYRVDGQTGGSLAGTPFDAGQPLDGLFF